MEHFGFCILENGGLLLLCQVRIGYYLHERLFHTFIGLHGAAEIIPLFGIIENCGSTMVRTFHAAPGPVFGRSISDRLHRTEEPAHERDAEECINVVVEIEHTGIFVRIERLIADDKGIHDTSGNLFGIFTE